MEEKASRKERKKEVVEVLRVRVGGCDHICPPSLSSYLPGRLGPVFPLTSPILLASPFGSSQCPLTLVVLVGGGKQPA